MDTRELLAHRSGPSQRMTIPVDADTTRRLERVIKWRLDSDAGLPWYRRLLRWLKWRG